MIPFLLTALLLSLQDPSMEELLKQCAAEDVAVRSRAAEAIQAGWRRWTDQDLALLARAAEGRDADAGAAARACLKRIQESRAIPEGVWKRFPTAASKLHGTGEEATAFLEALVKAWTARELATADVLILAMGSLTDSRENGRTYDGGRHFPDRPQQVADVAWRVIYDVYPGLAKLREPDQILAHWEKIKDKPEKDWFLADLDSDDERTKGAAIHRLIRLEDASVYDRAFKSLRTIEDEYSVKLALRDAGRLPPEILRSELLTYLSDPRLEVRFIASQHLWTLERAKVVDALENAIDQPEKLEYGGLHVTELRSMVKWMVETREERWISSLARRLREAPFRVKSEILCGFDDADCARTNEVLAGSLHDTDLSSSSLTWGELKQPRICDIAGCLLGDRLRVEMPSSWSGTLTGRDANLAAVWKAYRAKAGLPPAPFYPGGIEPVAKDKIEPLITGLLSKSEEDHRRAFKALSELGPGAWAPLRDLAKDRAGSEREMLEGAVKRLSSTLRSVEGNEAAKVYLDKLRGRLHEPLDPDVLMKEALDSWFADPVFTSLEVAVVRRTQGGGVTVRLTAERRKNDDPAPNCLFYLFEDGGGLVESGEEGRREVSERFLKGLKEVVQSNTDGQVMVEVQLRKLQRGKFRR